MSEPRGIPLVPLAFAACCVPLLWIVVQYFTVGLGANPIYQFVKVMRDATYLLVWPSALTMLAVVAWSSASFLIGWAVFRRFGATVSEEL